VNILVVDDHPLVLDALRQNVKKLDRAVAVSTAQTRAECLTRLTEAEASEQTDLILLDLGLPGANGLSLVGEVRSLQPGIPMVVVSATDDSETINQAIDMGAMGFIPKSSTPDVMLSALRLVLSGGIYLPPAALAPKTRASALAPVRFAATVSDIGLTPRQSEVMALLLQGKPNKLICRDLNLAEGTVKVHVASILRAVGVSTRNQLLVEASKRGWRIDDLV
jgi:DNA-binding NarL/FixJ family response regulator